MPIMRLVLSSGLVTNEKIELHAHAALRPLPVQISTNGDVKYTLLNVHTYG